MGFTGSNLIKLEQVSGVPTLRRIRGGREIDIYRDGSMFEKNNFIGYDKR